MPTSPHTSSQVLGMHIEPLRTYTSCSFFSSPLDLMKSKMVDESLSTTATRFLFQRESTYFYFMIQQNKTSAKTKLMYSGHENMYYNVQNGIEIIGIVCNIFMLLEQIDELNTKMVSLKRLILMQMWLI